MTRLVLGSASSGRRKVLVDAGVDPLVVVSGVDEDAIVDGLGSHATPAEVTIALATAKAEHVAGRLDPATAADCVVVGCDSMLYIDGELRGKPQTVDAARRQWKSMGGRSGQLFTGHCLIRLRHGEIAARNDGCSATTVKFGIPSDDDLDAYLRSGEPVTVAGGFTLDGLGGWFVEGIEGDPSTVIGIGLPLLRTLLEELGVSVARLWQSRD